MYVVFESFDKKKQTFLLYNLSSCRGLMPFLTIFQLLYIVAVSFIGGWMAEKLDYAKLYRVSIPHDGQKSNSQVHVVDTDCQIPKFQLLIFIHY